METSVWARLRRLKGRKLAAAARRSRPVQWVWSDRYLVIYRSGRTEAEAIAPPSREINVNSLDDLAKFEQTKSWLTPETFLTKARQRIAAGEMVFTATANGKLVYFCWLVPEQHNGHFPYIDQAYVYPPGSAVMYNAYSHPDARGQGLHRCGLKAIIRWALADPDTNYTLGSDDLPLCRLEPFSITKYSGVK